MKTKTLLLLTALVVCTLGSTTSAFAIGRKALIIGNSDYFDPALPKDEQPSNLKNPVNDAQLMENTFRRINFVVSKYSNLDLVGMKKALRDFRSILSKGDMAVVYFSGHGMQIKGENYLIPIHFNASFEYEAKDKALALTTITEALEDAETDLKIVFLDSCRNDPGFKSFNRSGSRGPAEVRNTGLETMICFATKHGEVAKDNPDQNNSNYTQALSEVIPLPGVKIEDAMKRVAQQVMLRSNNQQQPFTYGNLVQDWMFVGEGGVVAQPSQPAPPADASGSANAALVAEIQRMKESIALINSQPRPAESSATNTAELLAEIKRLSDTITQIKNNPPAAPVPTVSYTPPPPVNNNKESVLAFLKQWWDHNSSDDANDWVSDFSSQVDYCYYEEPGYATRSFIRQDRQKLINRWPSRNYDIAEGTDNPSYSVSADGSTATLRVRYTYRYSGPNRSASGTSAVTLGLVRSGSSWLISTFEERVIRE